MEVHFCHFMWKWLLIAYGLYSETIWVAKLSGKCFCFKCNVMWISVLYQIQLMSRVLTFCKETCMKMDFVIAPKAILRVVVSMCVCHNIHTWVLVCHSDLISTLVHLTIYVVCKLFTGLSSSLLSFYHFSQEVYWHILPARHGAKGTARGGKEKKERGKRGKREKEKEKKEKSQLKFLYHQMFYHKNKFLFLLLFYKIFIRVRIILVFTVRSLHLTYKHSLTYKHLLFYYSIIIDTLLSFLN